MICIIAFRNIRYPFDTCHNSLPFIVYYRIFPWMSTGIETVDDTAIQNVAEEIMVKLDRYQLNIADPTCSNYVDGEFSYSSKLGRGKRKIAQRKHQLQLLRNLRVCLNQVGARTSSRRVV